MSSAVLSVRQLVLAALLVFAGSSLYAAAALRHLAAHPHSGPFDARSAARRTDVRGSDPWRNDAHVRDGRAIDDAVRDWPTTTTTTTTTPATTSTSSSTTTSAVPPTTTTTTTSTTKSTTKSTSTTRSKPSSSNTSKSSVVNPTNNTTPAPKQVVVLAMHHSGTSLLTRILIQMGLYGGERHEFKLQNPAKKTREPSKFWERHDVVEITELVVNETLFERDPGWITGYQFRASSVSPSRAAVFRNRMRQIVDTLEARRSPIVLKEPRMSITYPFWGPVLDQNAVCVMIYRHPYLVATGLRARPRNRGMSLAEWLALWEKYQIGALRACAARPRVLVAHDELARAPAAAVARLHAALARLGVRGLDLPSDEWLRAFLPPYAARPVEAALDARLAPPQRRLWALFASGRAARETPEWLGQGDDALSELEMEPEAAKAAIVDAQEYKSFSSALQASSIGDDVVIIPSNSFFADLARNQVCSMRRVGVEPLVLGLDDHFCTAMAGMHVPCYYDDAFGVGVADLQRWSLDPQGQYFRILQLKMAYVENAINAGFNVLLADADIAWKANVHELLRARAHDPESGADMLIQSDARPNVVGKDDWICAGFFYMKSNERTKLFMQTTREVMKAYGAPDQDVWQLILFGSGQNFNFPKQWKTVKRSHAESPWQDAHEMGLTFKVLDPLAYANGGRFFGPGDKAEIRSKALVVHANMRGFPKKVSSLKQHSLWFVDELDVDKCVPQQ